MNIIFLIIVLLLFVPVKFKIKLDKELKMYFVLFYFLRINLNYIILINKFITQRLKRSTSASEIFENSRKIINIRFIIYDFLKLSTLNKFTLILELPIDELEYYPYFYTLFMSSKEFTKIWIDNRFKNAYNTNIDFREINQKDDFNIYFNSIVSTRLVNILIVGFKYFSKIPILFKRIT